ncbi:MAG: type VI secretion system baseplate subunit TssE [Burkholderiales bacterium]|nr:type VI secretion system baseplate subunit TssE [Burkholderiales bacterium]
MPLFDRLSSSESLGSAGAYLLSPEQLEASIARELSRLFNTRCRLMPSQYKESTGTVIDYGIPDFSALSPRRGEDRELLESALTRAVSFYETRLANVSVKVASVPQRGDTAIATVSGDVMIGLKAQRMSFALNLNPSQDDATPS